MVFRASALGVAASFVAAGCGAASEDKNSGGALVDVRIQQFTDRPIPRFAVDAAWPDLPDDVILGQVPGWRLTVTTMSGYCSGPTPLVFQILGSIRTRLLLCAAAQLHMC
ncbi:hypothetical protein ACFOOP_06790 [Marinicaulis aureus]|uniref:Uncharacterized protein n=1 Tax=Hyphococcus aureus TaxID=2666033 RepID=A0ABW1KTC5_9PROT